MKILHFIYDHPNNPWVGGGGARRVARIAEELWLRGHHIELVSGSFPGCEEELRERYRWQFLGSSDGYGVSVGSYILASWGALLRRSRGFDLVIEDFSVWNPLFSEWFARAPAMLQIQNYLGREIRRRYGVGAIGVELLEKFYPRFFANRAVLSRDLTSRYGISAFISPMGVEADWLERPSEAGAYVAYLGRIEFHQKGLDHLVRAASGFEMPVKFAGFGPDTGRLREACASEPNMEFLGPFEGLGKREFLERAHVVVIPSRFEGQPMVALEAAALGRPLVVSDIDELRFIEREGFGIRVNAANPRGFQQAVNDLCRETQRWAAASSAGRAFARDRTWERVVDGFENYCLLLAAEGGEHR